MTGVEFFSGILFPFLNFLIFLVVAVYFFRKPLGAFAVARREKFLHEAREASDKADEVARLEHELQEGTRRIDQDLSNLEQQTIADAERQATQIITEAEKTAARIKAEATQVAEAFTTEMQNELKREILRRVREELQGELPRHREQSDVWADAKVQGATFVGNKQ